VAEILIVDPDRVNAKLMVIVLEDAGFETRSVATTDDALAAIAAKRPDAVALELVVPTLGGIDLIRILKSDANTRDIAIIAVTAIDGASLELLALEIGCAAYVRKPIDVLQFPAIVRSVLGGGP
jgi:CheY-like chemotaxis protein